VVDCKGMVCPKPQLLTKKAASEMKEGEVAEVLITNPASVEAVPRIIEKSNSTVLGTIKEGNLWKLYFRKGK
jgi:tRNA 2-thiouridine synthesizing protein A